MVHSGERARTLSRQETIEKAGKAGGLEGRVPIDADPHAFPLRLKTRKLPLSTAFCRTWKKFYRIAAGVKIECRAMNAETATRS